MLTYVVVVASLVGTYLGSRDFIFYEPCPERGRFPIILCWCGGGGDQVTENNKKNNSTQKITTSISKAFLRLKLFPPNGFLLWNFLSWWISNLTCVDLCKSHSSFLNSFILPQGMNVQWLWLVLHVVDHSKSPYTMWNEWNVENRNEIFISIVPLHHWTQLMMAIDPIPSLPCSLCSLYCTWWSSSYTNFMILFQERGFFLRPSVSSGTQMLPSTYSSFLTT